jgi:hypothetical protein
LNLFVTQLRGEKDKAEKIRLIARIDAAVSAMNELFNELLDMSRLDAGVLVPSISEFPVDQLLKRIEMTFAAAARENDLRLHVVPSNAWIRGLAREVLILLGVGRHLGSLEAARDNPPDARHANSLSNSFACFKSNVSNPSVNQASTGASRSWACCLLPWSRHSRAMLVAARSS